MLNFIIGLYDKAAHVLGLDALTKAGFSVEESRSLYARIEQHPQRRKVLENAAVRLKLYGVSYSTNPEIYHSLIGQVNLGENVERITSTLSILTAARLTFADSPDLCRAMIPQENLRNKINLVVAKAFKLLLDQKLDFAKDREIFDAFADKPSHAELHIPMIGALQQAGVGLTVNSTCFKAIRSLIVFPHQNCQAFANAVVALKGVGGYFAHGVGFWTNLLTSQNIDAVAPAISGLNNAGVILNSKLCHIVISRINSSEKFISGFNCLKNMGVPFAGNDAFCESVIIHAPNRETLEPVLAAFGKAGMTFEKNFEWYELVVVKSRYAQPLAKALNALHMCGVTPDNQRKLFDQLLWQPELAEGLAVNLDEMQHQGIRYVYNSEFFAIPLLINHADLWTYVLQELRLAGYRFKDYPGAYQKLREMVKTTDASFTHVKAALDKLCAFAQTHALVRQEDPGYEPGATELAALLQTTGVIHAAGFENPNLKAKAHNVLREAGLSRQAQGELIHKIDPNVLIAAKEFLVLLKKMDVPYDKDATLCGRLIRAQAKDLRFVPVGCEWPLYHSIAIGGFHLTVKPVFNLFKSLGVPYQQHPEICEAVLQTDQLSRDFVNTFGYLRSIQITYQTNLDMCLAIVNNPFDQRNFEGIVPILRDCGIDLKAYPQICTAVLSNTVTLPELSEDLNALQGEGLTYSNSQAVYDWIFAHYKSSSDGLEVNQYQASQHLDDIFKWMKALLIRVINNPAVVNVNTLFTHDQLVVYVLEQLHLAGYREPYQPRVFAQLFKMLSDQVPDSRTMIAMVNALTDFVKQSPLLKPEQPGYQQQLAVIDVLIAQRTKAEPLPFGPLMKADTTVLVERLVDALSTRDNFANAQLVYENGSYYLTLPGYSRCNLNVLLQNSNLSHLCLSDACLLQLDLLLRPLLKTDQYELDEAISQAMRLEILKTKLQGTVFAIYTEYGYKHMNALFRAEPLDLSDDDFTYVKDPKHNSLVCFLLACVLNDALNKLHWIPGQTWLDSVVLDRQERSTKEVELRNLNDWRFPALTSFSVARNGSHMLAEDMGKRTKLINGRGYIVQQREMEIIYSQGTQVRRQTVTDHFDCLEVVCSPALERNHYRSDVAQEHANTHHLQKPYQDEQHFIEIDNYRVERHNHGSAHNDRVVDNVNAVVNYYSHFAKDPEFKRFCQVLTDEAEESIRVAAAFRVTGRESEVSFKEDPAKYQRYKVASAAHFKQFVMQKTRQFAVAQQARPNQETDELAEVITHLGNPNYPTQINFKAEPARSRCNYYFYILKLAHDLDLLRCYTVVEFTDNLQPSLDISVSSDAQRASMQDLLRYSAQRIKAHGCALTCDIQPNGDLVNASLAYRSEFAIVSRSLKALKAYSNSVPRPKLLRADSDVYLVTAAAVVPGFDSSKAQASASAAMPRSEDALPANLTVTSVPKLA